MRPLKTLKKLYDDESHIIITEKGSRFVTAEELDKLVADIEEETKK